LIFHEMTFVCSELSGSIVGYCTAVPQCFFELLRILIMILIMTEATRRVAHVITYTQQ
jgi:hypothetical protein